MRLWPTLKSIVGKNRLLKSFIGQGYHGTHTPGVIQRNILENPGWYTAYTPYQAEIAQGRLEALLNFQTMITDLTGLDVANASLLDEGTAAAEAMSLALAGKPKGKAIFVSDRCHPQTIDVVVTRAEPLGIEVITGDWQTYEIPADGSVFAVLVQYPDTRGRIDDFTGFFAKAKAAGAVTIVAADILALTVLKAPGRFGADICIGSSQRFGVPMGFGGPHAAFMACTGRAETQDARPPDRRVHRCARQARLPALAANPRAAHPPRQGDFQHLHRPGAARRDGLDVCRLSRSGRAETHRQRGAREGGKTRRLAQEGGPRSRRRAVLRHHRHQGRTPGKAAQWVEGARTNNLNIRLIDEDHVGISVDETTEWSAICTCSAARLVRTSSKMPALRQIPASLRRDTDFLTQKVFNSYHSETEMLRYLKRLESKDLALNESMIALGLLHHETQRHLRDDAAELAGSRIAASLRARRPEPGLPRDARIVGRLAGGSHRLRRRLAATERRIAGRIRGFARHPPLSSLPR